MRGLFQQQIALNNIAAGPAGQKLIVEHSDQKKTNQPKKTEPNSLHPQQNLPSDCSGNFNSHVSEDSGEDPSKIRGLERLRHLGTLFMIVEDPDQQRDCDRQLNNGDENFLHPPKCSFHFATER